MGKNLQALLVYMLICLLTFIVGALFVEFVLRPFIVWLQGGKLYYFPNLKRIYGWCKLIVFAAILCGFWAWLCDKNQINR
ncbi:hypothetical protein IHE31_06165 [Mycetohabitans rhizoxinica]|uniref:Uncharacterized protein n=1 Tax=Mycetohabitans rhizoxinica (strain DSM 19002 / CIP 109453 / HKI 454) TaxID=882378 RepID=E5AMU0_MYCRK|nr:hypothetical protein [Mycetohabitans rhizoxinica]CBW74021.1 unnamed protein product [Mycetohabitans rhizoxinica HKI 454]